MAEERPTLEFVVVEDRWYVRALPDTIAWDPTVDSAAGCPCVEVDDRRGWLYVNAQNTSRAKYVRSEDAPVVWHRFAGLLTGEPPAAQSPEPAQPVPSGLVIPTSWPVGMFKAKQNDLFVNQLLKAWRESTSGYAWATRALNRTAPTPEEEYRQEMAWAKARVKAELDLRYQQMYSPARPSPDWPSGTPPMYRTTYPATWTDASANGRDLACSRTTWTDFLEDTGAYLVTLAEALATLAVVPPTTSAVIPKPTVLYVQDPIALEGQASRTDVSGYARLQTREYTVSGLLLQAAKTARELGQRSRELQWLCGPVAGPVNPVNAVEEPDDTADGEGDEGARPG